MSPCMITSKTHQIKTYKAVILSEDSGDMINHES